MMREMLLNKDIRYEAFVKLKGKFFIFGLIILIMTGLNWFVSLIPLLPIIATPFICFIIANSGLIVIDEKQLSMENVVDFKGRGLYVFLGGILFYFMKVIVFVVVNLSLLKLIGFDKFYLTFKENNFTISSMNIADLLTSNNLIHISTTHIILLVLSVIIGLFILLFELFYYLVISDEEITDENITLFGTLRRTSSLLKRYFIKIILFEFVLLFLILLTITLMLEFGTIMAVVSFLFIIFFLTPFAVVANANLYRTISSERN